jgi:hypothetical protein
MTTIALLAAVIFLLSQAVSGYLRASYEHEPLIVTPLMVGGLAAAGILCLAATVIPLWVGLKKMESFDF